MHPDRKKFGALSERLASHGIMGARLETPLSPSLTMVLRKFEGFQMSPQLILHDVERHQCLSKAKVFFLYGYSFYIPVLYLLIHYLS